MMVDGNVAYFVYSVAPSGFILVPTIKEMWPIKAYSRVSWPEGAHDNPVYNTMAADYRGFLSWIRTNMSGAGGVADASLDSARALRAWQAVLSNEFSDAETMIADPWAKVGDGEYLLWTSWSGSVFLTV
jgi:hypothetical protein